MITVESTMSSRHLVLASFLLGAGLLLAGCRNDPSAPQNTRETTDAEEEIRWFEGDVKAAFALAKAEGKPLFLYWGAEWCPPCHVIKNKIFSRPEFVARMHDFVPVYLDGDTERAQILGEELAVMGYPTVIIFDPLGQEVMRMPNTVSIDQYETVLDSAVATMKPIKTVLEQVLSSGPPNAQREDLNLLAYYSWGQDSRVNLSIDEQIAAFQRLYEEIPSDLGVERSRFLGLYLMSLAQKTRYEDGAAPVLDEPQRARLQADLISVLLDPELRNSNLLWITYYADSIIDLLRPQLSAERSQLIAAWQQAGDALEADTSLAVGDRLNATRLKLELAALGDQWSAREDEYQVPGYLQDHARNQAAWAMETVADESELQSVVNTLAYLLEDAGLSDEAEAMLLEKMNDTVAPYYFMSWIAGLREEAGDTEAAIQWHRKAYDSATGRYSRFRWGSTYLRRLMILAPESTEKIEADSVEVLSELLSHPDAFAGSNHSRLVALEEAIRKWNQDGLREEEVSRIHDFVTSSCDRYPGKGVDSQRHRCETFLLPDPASDEEAI